MSEIKKPEAFNVQFNEFQIFSTLLSTNSEKYALMIHGGARNQDTFLDLRQWFGEHLNIGSIAFDCIGHGQSEGQLSDSSLSQRTQQAIQVIQNCHVKVNLCIGVSMGAYNAIQLSRLLELDALILIVPGIYTPSAYHVNFGEKFSEIIRTKNSWMNSDAWEILSTFKGKLLIVSAENDEVVPSAIPQKLYESAHHASWKQHLIIPNAIHKKFINSLWENEHDKASFLTALEHCVSN